MKLIVRYDAEADVLYLAVPGKLDYSDELYPDINVEMNAEGQPIGIEILGASRLLKDIVGPLHQKVAAPGSAIGEKQRLAGR